MSQVLALVDSKKVYLVGDTLYSGPAESDHFMKVFKINDKMLGAALGGTVGIEILVSPRIQRSKSLKEVIKIIRKEWNAYYEKYEDILKDKRTIQTFVLVGVKKNKFRIIALSAKMGEPLKEEELSVNNGDLHVFGPVADSNNKTPKEYIDIAKREILEGMNGQHLTFKKRAEKFNSAIVQASVHQLFKEKRTSIGLPIAGWRLSRKMKFKKVYHEIKMDSSFSMWRIRNKLRKILDHLSPE